MKKIKDFKITLDFNPGNPQQCNASGIVSFRGTSKIMVIQFGLPFNNREDALTEIMKALNEIENG